MTEKPILFQGDMVRALLAGTKTQTRRAVKPMRGLQSTWLTADLLNKSPKLEMCFTNPERRYGAQMEHPKGGPLGWIECHHGQSGTRLWVRESWAQRGQWRIPAWPDADADDAYWYGTNDVIYTACDEKPTTGWRGRPSIHMPRWASRILLEIVSVRVERLQDISEADALAEGIVALPDGFGLTDGSHFHTADPRVSYFSLWESINGAGSVEANPWLWAITFKRIAP